LAYEMGWDRAYDWDERDPRKFIPKLLRRMATEPHRIRINGKLAEDYL
jgi:hypothetical protein